MKAVVTDYMYTTLGASAKVFEEAGIEFVVGQCHSADDVVELAHDADAIINTYVRIDEPLLRSLPKCRVVVHYGTGVDSIDVAAATRLGVYVANVPDYFQEEVSLHVVGFLLALARGIVVLDRDVKQGLWNFHRVAPLHRLSSQTLGVVGFGSTGKAVAARALSLGLNVIAYARTPDPELARESEVQFLPLDDVLSQADYLSVHIRLTPETRHFIGRRELGLMKSTAYLINITRGAVVDQTALVEALHNGVIAGAAVDVLEWQPPAADDPILALDNVIITPHMAWYSEESQALLAAQAAREAVRVLRGHPPESLVNPSVVSRYAGDQ